MGPVDALELALSKEKEAMTLYRDLSLRYPEIQDTFLFLIVEEEKHQKILENKIAELTRY